jgi:hypothetical protein
MKHQSHRDGQRHAEQQWERERQAMEDVLNKSQGWLSSPRWLPMCFHACQCFLGTINGDTGNLRVLQLERQLASAQQDVLQLQQQLNGNGSRTIIPQVTVQSSSPPRTNGVAPSPAGITLQQAEVRESRAWLHEQHGGVCSIPAWSSVRMRRI